MSRYFDMKLLQTYLDYGLDFKVFIKGRYLTVTDPYDLISKRTGYGYESSGKQVQFDFMDIDHIKVGTNILTKQDLIKLSEPKNGDEEE